MLRVASVVALLVLAGCSPDAVALPSAAPLTADEVRWCQMHPELVVDAYDRLDAPAIEGDKHDVVFLVTINLEPAEMVLGSAPPLTAEQVAAVRMACRDAHRTSADGG